MKRQANGIGNYKRKRSPNGVFVISEESRARLDATDRICRERAAAAYGADRTGREREPGQKMQAAA